MICVQVVDCLLICVSCALFVCVGSTTKDAGDRVYDSMREGTHTVGETHLPLGNATVGGAGPRFSNSTVKAVFIDALDTVTNASESAVCPTLVVPEDYTPNGEGPRTGQPESHLVRSPKSLEKPQKERVLILAANSGGSCTLRLGDYYNFLSLLDKLQYGNVHGYDVLLGLGNVDDDLRKTWNKVAWMQKVCCAFCVLLRYCFCQELCMLTCTCTETGRWYVVSVQLCVHSQ